MELHVLPGKPSIIDKFRQPLKLSPGLTPEFRLSPIRRYQRRWRDNSSCKLIFVPNYISLSVLRWT